METSGDRIEIRWYAPARVHHANRWAAFRVTVEDAMRMTVITLGTAAGGLYVAMKLLPIAVALPPFVIVLFITMSCAWAVPFWLMTLKFIRPIRYSVSSKGIGGGYWESCEAFDIEPDREDPSVLRLVVWSKATKQVGCRIALPDDENLRRDICDLVSRHLTHIDAHEDADDLRTRFVVPDWYNVTCFLIVCVYAVLVGFAVGLLKQQLSIDADWLPLVVMVLGVVHPGWLYARWFAKRYGCKAAKRAGEAVAIVCTLPSVFLSMAAVALTAVYW